ncbi:ribonuclease [Novosphingobium sp.]|uniref:ribonuclease n=1 Tax=Novosphingobium sp. TaxID=1874826 RepID=UPI0038BBC085
MPEWLIEEGIAETRAILVENGEILASRVVWDDEPWRAGAVTSASLLHRVGGTRRGAVRLPDNSVALIDGLDGGLTEGAALMVQVTRAAMAERGRSKLPQVRPAPQRQPTPAPTLAEELSAGPHPVRTLRITDRSFDVAGWDDLVEQALTGEVAFSGGTLLVCPTPAMTLIDIDGALPLRALALAAVPAIAGALARLDIGGSVGIDFPSLEHRADRQTVDAALAEALSGWRGERTGMNGFGFVQLVARLERPSLVARSALHAAGAAARRLLRQAERVQEPGVLLLTAAPAVLRALRPQWEAELARRSGRSVRRVEDARLALHAGFAQAVVP